jgi:Tol biopolymer transport system component
VTCSATREGHGPLFGAGLRARHSGRKMKVAVWIHRIDLAQRFGATWLILGLVSIVSLVACGGSNETSSEPTGTIAFTVNRSGFGEIWVMDSEGRNRIQLTEASQPEVDASGSTSPAWSPDGTLIAYSGSGEAIREDQRDLEIYVMRADGSESRRLTNDQVLDATPAWSPDGKRIAFAHTPESGTEDADGVIVVMDADGRGRVEITRHPDTPDIVFDSQPAWSPDGSLIAFARATFTLDGEARIGIYTIDPTGAGERLLIEDAADPAWSPDGSRIVFTSTRDRFGETCFHDCSPSGEIYVARADGTDPRRLTTSQADDHSPTWAPDGEHIAFTSDRSNRDAHENEIYVMAVDGGDLQRLTTNDVWDLEPAWR